MAISKVVYKSSSSATPVVWMDTTDKTVDVDKLLTGYTALKADGTSITGTYSPSGGSSYTLLGSDEFTVNTSSTTATEVGSFTVQSTIWTSDKLVYVRIRDKAGKRAGYFYGTDSFYMNEYPANSDTTQTYVRGFKQAYRYASNSKFSGTASTAEAGYGVYPRSIESDGTVTIYSRYNATNSLTINGTYLVQVYLLDYPDNISPYA